MICEHHDNLCWPCEYCPTYRYWTDPLTGDREIIKDKPLYSVDKNETS